MVNRLLWRIGRLARGMGTPGALGAGLLAAGALLVIFGLSAESERMKQLEARREAAQATLLRGPADGEKQGAEGQEDFYAALTGAEQIPDVLSDIERAARKHGLDFDQAQYQWTTEAKVPIARYRITLPLSGGYRALRGFLAEVLGRHAALALDELKIERDTIGATEVEAAVRLTLFVRTGP